MSDMTGLCKFKFTDIVASLRIAITFTPTIRIVKVAGLVIPRVPHLTVAQYKENATKTNLGFYYQSELNIH